MTNPDTLKNINPDTVKYMVKDGERLDQIIFNYYDIKTDQLGEVLEFVYNANPNLAAIKQPFNSALNGVLFITLPPLPQVTKKRGLNLWD